MLSGVDSKSNDAIVASMSEQRVEIGSTVRVILESGAPVSFTIVHPLRTDPGRGIISCDSPLGKALLGKRTGDKVTYTVDNRILQADIVEIFPETKNA